jgi:uncharacterized protein (TIGR00725 family)
VRPRLAFDHLPTFGRMTAQDLKQRHRQSAAVRRRRVVAVIGSRDEADVGACLEVGGLIAELGCDLLTGAGGGVMAEVSRAFCEKRDAIGAPGLAIGIVPGEIDGGGGYATPVGYPNPWVDLPIYTHLSRLSRNHINVLSADAIVALPGGSGTKSEADLAKQYGVAVIAYGSRGPAGVERIERIEQVREFLVNQLSQP